MNNEFTRMQELAGINEIKVFKPTSHIEDFLNQHKEEVFEKMFTLDNDGDIDINKNIIRIENWEEYHDDHFDYTCAQIGYELPNANLGAQARFTPFPPGSANDDYTDLVGETNIAGKTVYYLAYNY